MITIMFYTGFFLVNLFLGVILMTMVDVYCKKYNYDFGESQMFWVLVYTIGITLMYIGVFGI
jgi:predicted Zn-dependent protease